MIGLANGQIIQIVFTKKKKNELKGNSKYVNIRAWY